MLQKRSATCIQEQEASQCKRLPNWSTKTDKRYRAPIVTLQPSLLSVEVLKNNLNAPEQKQALLKIVLGAQHSRRRMYTERPITIAAEHPFFNGKTQRPHAGTLAEAIMR
jgi:hypothetical protein